MDPIASDGAGRAKRRQSVQLDSVTPANWSMLAPRYSILSLVTLKAVEKWQKPRGLSRPLSAAKKGTRSSSSHEFSIEADGSAIPHKNIENPRPAQGQVARLPKGSSSKVRQNVETAEAAAVSKKPGLMLIGAMMGFQASSFGRPLQSPTCLGNQRKWTRQIAAIVSLAGGFDVGLGRDPSRTEQIELGEK